MSMLLVLAAQAVAPPPVIRVVSPPPPLPSIPAAPLLVKARPIGQVGRWIVDGDYPDASLTAGEQGRAVALLTVSPEGRVSHCDLVEKTAYERLNSATCRMLLRRGTYEPARDFSGQPVSDTVRQPVVWQLADARQVAVHRATLKVRVVDGEDMDCRDVEGDECDAPDVDFARLAAKLVGDGSVDTRLVSALHPGRDASRSPALVEPGATLAFDASARLTIRPNGSVTQCVELPGRTGGTGGELCEALGDAIFTLLMDGDASRTLVWRVTLSSKAREE